LFATGSRFRSHIFSSGALRIDKRELISATWARAPYKIHSPQVLASTTGMIFLALCRAASAVATREFSINLKGHQQTTAGRLVDESKLR
jgi:hypothetical protein